MSNGRSTAEPLSLTEFKKQKGLKIVHLNVRSFFKKKDTIELDLLDGELDILGLSETWLKEEIPNNMLNVHNYQLIRLDRQQRNSLGHTKAGGGICLFIKNNIIYDEDMFKHLNTSEKNLEAQFVLIAGKNARKIIIANCYRPPNGNIDLGMNVLKTQLGSIRNIDKYELVIMGDLNLDCKEKDSESCKIISDICEGFSLKNLIQTPTRVTHDHTAILDLILTNVANTFKSGVINYNISDHSPVFMIKKRQKIKHERGYVIGRSYMNYNKIAFQNNLKNLDWSIIFLLDNPNEAWNMLYKAILLEADKMCPKRKIKISYNRPTWLTEELTEIGRERDIAFRYARRKKSEAAFAHARNLRNEYNREIHNATCEYVMGQLEKHKHDQKKFWSSIKNVMPSKGVTKSVREVVNPVTGKMCTGKESVEVINSFFTNIGPNLNNKLPPSSDTNTIQESDVSLENIEILSNENVTALVKSLTFANLLVSQMFLVDY